MKLLAVLSQQSDTVFFWCDKAYEATYDAFARDNGLQAVSL